MTVAKLPIDGTSVTLTASHIGALGACGYGTNTFRTKFPKGIVLTQQTLDTYYQKRHNNIAGMQYTPSWVFSRIGFRDRDEGYRYPVTAGSMFWDSRDARIVAVRKELRELEKKQAAEVRAATAKIEKKYKALIAKKRAPGMKVARSLAAAKNKPKKTKPLSLASFAGAVNSAVAARARSRSYNYM